MPKLLELDCAWAIYPVVIKFSKANPMPVLIVTQLSESNFSNRDHREKWEK
jgi:hypothetical protein